MIFPCIYVLYPELGHPLHFSCFYLSPLLMVISTGLKKVYIHSCTQSTSPIFTFFNRLLPVCLFFILILRCLGYLFIVQLGITPVHTSYLSQCNLPPTHTHIHTALPCTFRHPVFNFVFHHVLFLHRYDVFHYYSLFLVSATSPTFEYMLCIYVYIIVCVCVCIYIYIYIYIYIGSIFHIWEKTCDLWISELC
jgi:hypothetical protein